jgi:hypothetical protein
MSDIAIIKMSGFLDLLEKDDSVMADKGFKISKLLEGKGVASNLPPFLANMQQFTPEQVKETEEIASVRIHVERAIGRVKEYRIFDKVPLSMMGSINQLWVLLMKKQKVPRLTQALNRMLGCHSTRAYARFKRKGAERMHNNQNHFV